MRITTYRAELNEDRHNILVKENSCNYPVDSLNNPQAVAEMLNGVFRLNRQAEEHVYMIALNTKGKPLGIFEISLVDAVKTTFQETRITCIDDIYKYVSENLI